MLIKKHSLIRRSLFALTASWVILALVAQAADKADFNEGALEAQHNAGYFAPLADANYHIAANLNLQDRSALGLTCRYFHKTVGEYHNIIFIHKDVNLVYEACREFESLPNALFTFQFFPYPLGFTKTEITKIEAHTFKKTVLTFISDLTKLGRPLPCSQGFLLAGASSNKCLLNSRGNYCPYPEGGIVTGISSEMGFPYIMIEGKEVLFKTILPHIPSGYYDAKPACANKSTILLTSQTSGHISVHGIGDVMGRGRSVHIGNIKDSVCFIPCGEKFFGTTSGENLLLINPELEHLIEREFSIPDGYFFNFNGPRCLPADENHIVFTGTKKEEKSRFANAMISGYGRTFFSINTCSDNENLALTKFNLLPEEYFNVGYYLKNNNLFILGAHLSMSGVGEHYEGKDGIFLVYDMQEHRPLYRRFLDIKPVKAYLNENHLLYFARNLKTGDIISSTINLEHWLHNVRRYKQTAPEEIVSEKVAREKTELQAERELREEQDRIFHASLEASMIKTIQAEIADFDHTAQALISDIQALAIEMDQLEKTKLTIAHRLEVPKEKLVKANAGGYPVNPKVLTEIESFEVELINLDLQIAKIQEQKNDILAKVESVYNHKLDLKSKITELER